MGECLFTKTIMSNGRAYRFEAVIVITSHQRNGMGNAESVAEQIDDDTKYILRFGHKQGGGWFPGFEKGIQFDPNTPGGAVMSNDDRLGIVFGRSGFNAFDEAFFAGDITGYSRAGDDQCYLAMSLREEDAGGVTTDRTVIHIE